ncbi:S41 family peptidase [bacterium SCSIO 12643]|nr:S41 family peptidase [bacterium SCSIO 12643]
MKKIVVLMLVVPLLFSCEKVLFKPKEESSNPQANLDYLWNECNEKYAYFDLKNIDWDQVKVKYESQIYEGMTEDSLFSVLGGMLTELRDDHTNLVSNFNVSRFGVNYLSQDNFDWRIIEDNYLPRDYYVSGPFSHDFIANGEVGYVRFASFTGTVGSTNLDFILDRYKNTKGLILDLRENGGGAVSDVFSILSRFVDQETIVYYSRIKNGKGHNDFSEAMPAKVSPYGGIKYLKKVMVLVDRGTYSAGSFTSISTKAIPNMVLVGDTTGGGLGLPNGGQLPNGWNYRFSITQTLSLDQNPEYENGVPPDIHALMDWNDRTKDEVIETALKEIL